MRDMKPEAFTITGSWLVKRESLPQMIPRPQRIPQMSHKWSSNQINPIGERKWSREENWNGLNSSYLSISSLIKTKSIKRNKFYLSNKCIKGLPWTKKSH